MRIRRRYSDHPEVYRRVGLQEIAREIDRTPTQTRKLLDSLGYIGARPRIGRKPYEEITYDASVIEVVKALVRVPHRQLPGTVSWLDTWLGEESRGQTVQGSSSDAGQEHL